MSKIGQMSTKKVYEDPKIVEGYIKRHSINPEMVDYIERFSKSLPGKRVIDIGCGPGHDSYIFAKLGFEVVGIDYSSTMIDAAKALKNVKNKPKFQIADMKDFSKFKDNSFDGAWICSSIYHIPKDKIDRFLEDVHRIVIPNGRVFISLKEGKGKEILLKDEKYGKKTVREFSFWNKKEFEDLVRKLGFKIILVTNQKSGIINNDPVVYLRFELEVVK